MSIISQALQKVQREQRLQSPREMPYLLAGQRRHSPRRPWLALTLGCGAVLGLGWVVYGQLTTSTAHMPVVPEQSWMAQTPPGEPVLHERPGPVATGPEPVPQRGEPPGLQTPASTPVVVLAVEHRAVPAPVPRVPSMPLPVPMATPLPPAEENPDQAVANGDTTSLDIGRGQVLFQRGLAAQESGDLKRALALLEQAVHLDPAAKAAYNSLGNVYFQQKRFQQAVGMYHKALALDPDYAKARNNLGSAYMQLAMYDKAIEELQRALRADGSSSLVYYNLACVYARNGHSTTAVQYLQQAIALEPQARLWARTDADFARVRNTPEVQQLLEP